MSAFLIACLLCAVSVAAFGAGNIPSISAVEGISFRHGDIEDILLQLAMVPLSTNFLSGLNPLSSHGKKFNAMAVKRVYFGNWLRDFSQAVDVGTLSKGIDAKTIRLLVWVMGFLDFGYATEEFEVTEARLGVYRPEEHIDNPKGYPSPEEPDARKFDQRLRGPVQEVELQIDPATGMKNYIANERGGWMTSSAYVRNSLFRSIELGRSYKQTGSQAEKFESLRILGQALHTLEDFSAHSNFCELALVELGYHDVFCHVGTSTRIRLGNKEVYPLTTGTFGGLDFVHSLLGEATDKISQTQITEVQAGLASSSNQNSLSLLSNLQGLVTKIPGASSLSRDVDDMQAVSNEADNLRNSDQSYNRGSEARANYTPDEIAAKIYPVMAFRDRLMKGLSAFFEKIPGLNALIDRISETLTIWVLSTIEPFMKPIVEKITGALGAGQALVTSGEAQLEVFENARSSDPTHSMLAKDHFTCYLNQPAGLIGQAVVRHVVSRVVQAWADPSINPGGLVEEILEILHHPAKPAGRTGIQQEMLQIVRNWVDNLGAKRQKILSGLTMDGVKNGQHHEGGSAATTGAISSHSHQHSASNTGTGRRTQQADHQLYTSHDTDHNAGSISSHRPHTQSTQHHGSQHGVHGTSHNQNTDGQARPWEGADYNDHRPYQAQTGSNIYAVHPSQDQNYQPPNYAQGFQAQDSNHTVNYGSQMNYGNQYPGPPQGQYGGSGPPMGFQPQYDQQNYSNQQMNSGQGYDYNSQQSYGRPPQQTYGDASDWSRAQ